MREKRRDGKQEEKKVRNKNNLDKKHALRVCVFWFGGKIFSSNPIRAEVNTKIRLNILNEMARTLACVVFHSVSRNLRPFSVMR